MTAADAAGGDAGLAIRPAAAAHAGLIAEFNRALAAESEGLTLDTEVVAEGVQAVLADPARGRYFLAEVDGRVVGQMLITTEWSDWRNGWFWWVQSVYVLPDCRRRGVFGRLYTHILETARRRQDVCGLRLYVDRNNTPAREVYTRLGMTHTRYRLYEADWSSARGPE